MELRHLRYFVAVAEELHFGRAALRLHMAQPPLSQQIQQLEAEMAVKLFERTNRRVELTPAGQVFLQEARSILDSVEGAVTRAQRASRGEQGWFGVGFVGSANYDVLPTILRLFRERYPEVELVLQELLGEEQEQALREKRIHVAFTRLSTPEPGLTLEPLIQEPLLLAVPATHPFAEHKNVRLRDLAHEPFILFHQPSPSSYGSYLVRVCQDAGFTPRMVQRVGEVQTAISLVSAGIGITLVPSLVQNFQREGVVFKTLTNPTPTIGLMLLYREADASPILPHFLQIARETIQK
jgi:DNA-binding transcriptional LysR family regulator